MAGEDSAKGILTQFLDEWGLADLAEWAWGQYISGSPMEQVVLDIRGRPEYKARFPAMEARQREGMAISEATYIAYERQAREMMHNAGLPLGFYDDPTDLSDFIANDVSINELNDRIGIAQQLVYSIPQEDRDALEHFYGFTESDQLAFALDVERALPVVQKQYAAVQAAGLSARTGFGTLTQAEAEFAGRRKPEDIAREFANLTRSRAALSAMPGMRETAVSRETQLEASFGDSVAAKQAVEGRLQERVAEFQGAGDIATTQEGMTGLRPA